MQHDKLQRDLSTPYPIASDSLRYLTRELYERKIKVEMKAGKSYVTIGEQTIEGKIVAQWTGEKRYPRKGEWFLSGSHVEAYYAPQGCTQVYPIARLAIVEAITTYKTTPLPTGEQRERWAFSQAELDAPHDCHRDDELVAFVPGEEIGIMVHRNGKAAGSYADGTRGVPADVAELAEGVEDLQHPVDDDYNNLTFTSSWRDVIVTDDGAFVRFAEPAAIIV